MVMSDIAIPEEDLLWSYARSGGPGGQNVNKVSSKAILSWDYANSPHLSMAIKERLPRLFPRYATNEGWLVIASQEHRDQDKNRQACRDKLDTILTKAAHVPKARRATRPTRGSKMRRLTEKKLRSDVKTGRRRPTED
jgi:ribosome-associated protein